MRVIVEPAELVGALDDARRSGQRIGLVPTLGALHRGHGSLIAIAASQCDLVCVSDFVNPLQFGDPEDFARYPRDIPRDAEIAASHGAKILFAPTPDAMVGTDRDAVTVDPGPLGDLYEGASRPGHFRGVATIVTKLFALIWPVIAYFGEKDFQQLTIVRSLSASLLFPLEVVGCPTIREDDGLALSSRNARLSPKARAVAPMLHRALLEGRDVLASGGTVPKAESAMAAVVANEPQIELDYAICRDARTLGVARSDRSARRLLIAAAIDGIRMIDNIDASAEDSAVEYPAAVLRASSIRS